MTCISHLEILTYDGILGVRNISFLYTVLIRSGIQNTDVPARRPGQCNRCPSSDQPCSISDCLDTQIIWKVICAIEKSVLTFINQSRRMEALDVGSFFSSSQMFLLTCLGTTPILNVQWYHTRRRPSIIFTTRIPIFAIA